MSKTKTTTRKFYVVDLIRQKDFRYIKIEKTRVDIEIEVTTKGMRKAPDVPSAAMDRLEKAARDALNAVEADVVAQAKAADAEIGKLLDKGGNDNLAEADKKLRVTTAQISKKLHGAKGVANAAADARLEKEKLRDKALTESKVRTVIKLVTWTVKLGGSVASLAGSGGTNVAGYIAIINTAIEIGREIEQHLKGDATLRKDLAEGVEAYGALRDTAIKQAADKMLTDISGIDFKKPATAVKTIGQKVGEFGQSVVKGKTPDQVTKSVITFVEKKVKADKKSAEKARKAYRDHTTQTLKKTDRMSGAADKVMRSMKAVKATKGSPEFKEAIKLGAEAMKAKGVVRKMAATLEAREAFLDKMEAEMTLMGMTVDDRTTLRKIMDGDKATMLSTAMELKSIVDVFSASVGEFKKIAA
ncbi:MAG: hypothetical protein AAGD12_06110 [Pseudomonadota bacterium]